MPRWLTPPTTVARHVTQIVVESSADPAVQQVIESERPRMLSRVTGTCQTDAWAAPTRACFLRAKTTTDLEACGRFKN